MTADAGHLGTLLEAAELFGWVRHHQRPGYTRNGYRTAITGNPGFPDISLARRGHVLFFEVKGDGGYPTPDQLAWISNLPNAYVVRPAALDEALAIIAGKGRPPTLATCSLTFRHSETDTPPARWAGPLARWAETDHPATVLFLKGRK